MHYVFSRYATYFIQFINSLFIAVYLGPYYFGFWGFITLVIKYLQVMNFGISHSVNAIISIHKNKEWYVQKIIGTSLTMLAGLSVVVILFFVANNVFAWNIGSKYNFSIYAPAVAAIGILGYFNTLFSAVFRVYGKIIEIAINQSVFPILMLITILFFRGENLLWALVGVNLLSSVVSLSIYLVRKPIDFKPFFIPRLIKKIQIKGWHLFVYNTSFYLIVISTRSFVSAYYTVEEFGYFTFAFSLANAISLLIDSFAFLIYPKILNRFSNPNEQSNIMLLAKLRDIYITSSHLLVYIALVFFPLFLLLLPQYSNSLGAFSFIAFTIVLYSNSFGYSGLLIAKGFEKKIGLLSFVALLLNVTIVFVLTHFVKVHFSQVILGTMFTYLTYVFFVTREGRKDLKMDLNFKAIFFDAFPIRLMTPYFLAIAITIFKLHYLFFFIPLILFLIINFNAIKLIKANIGQIILRPKIIDI